jgi:hypothetical protein
MKQMHPLATRRISMPDFVTHEPTRCAVLAYAAIWDAIKLPDFSNPAVLRGIRKQLADEARRAPDSADTPIINASNALLRAYVAYLDSVIEGEPT